MDQQTMWARMREGDGIIAALDQSSGSTPKTLVGYGLSPDDWSDEEEMLALIHRMRCRILASPAFTAERVLAVILFEGTMQGRIEDTPVPQFLHGRGIVPFVKVDRGLEDEADGVQLMKPLTGLDDVLAEAREYGVFGTKMRSFIRSASASGIAEVIRQQFDVADTIAEQGFVPILEPEYDIHAADRARGEPILRETILRELDRRSSVRPVMLKLSIPVEPDTYLPLVSHPRVLRVAALSGGYSRRVACAKLALNHGMIASFSRALLEDLRVTMDEREFDAALATAVEEIYRASSRACE